MENNTLTAPQVVINTDKSTLDYNLLRRAVLTLRAVNHPLRKEMMELIDTKGKMTVSELYIKMKIEQSVASQHLALLRKADVLSTERDGKFIYYAVNHHRLQEIAALVEKLAQ